MKKTFIVLLIGLGLLLISACSNKDLESFNEEKVRLTNEILELKKHISEKDEAINHLKKVNSDETTKLGELRESLDMVRFSSYARLDDNKDTFDNLKNIYNIKSDYVIKDDWYVINEDYFQIELLEYENAKKVEFYSLRLESEEGPILVFSDTNPTDGWKYTNDNIGEIINKHKPHSNGASYKPYFLIYTEVTLKDGNGIRTSKLPIYNR
ncbi:hypothetical protein RRV45_10200 [Bacillus sp. DTU_2020_1000418_1_SI_GHA_SEK_038]|uniref:hypothetical protein n=1 Tax=Bacillus sp. DTU_2020_1000418_1_SI_GHA_SEK_038 TaxID=3077585 RepID=UPI0028E6F893|nr:hypothetical protein [Bacillus sp. DTU_2020_1000418_1_SI_GHA_SEK_038]WNS77330.1 hypothetical protein RRV45_10200 [Bacillus sp. DTU_2020_1000418_1_SI_GHA_SEK_038]